MKSAKGLPSEMTLEEKLEKSFKEGTPVQYFDKDKTTGHTQTLKVLIAEDPIPALNNGLAIEVTSVSNPALICYVKNPQTSLSW